MPEEAIRKLMERGYSEARAREEFNDKVGAANGYKTHNDGSEKWDYRGYKEAVDKIEQAVNAANTRTKVETAYKGITDQEKAITAELDRVRSGVKDAGDEKVLMTQRRRLRQQKQNLLNKGKALLDNSVNSNVKPTIPINEDRTVYEPGTEGGNIHMESIVESVKGIMESIHLSQERIEKGILSQKDQKNLIEMLGEIIESIDKREEFQENDEITQLKEHLGNIQEALFSKDPVKVISEQKETSVIVDQLSYEVTFNNLTMGIFQNDDQITQLQNEKADLVQQLIDLDMEVHGEISDITRQVLEVNHVNLGTENNKEQGMELKIDNVTEIYTKEDTKDNMQKEMDTAINSSRRFVGTVYLSGNETNKASFYGADLESVLNAIRKQQENADSSVTKAKTVYIKEQGATGASLKYDIASGKDITPIYLKLPFARKEEFKKITTYLKANGAVFNSHKKAWYVTKEQDLSKFETYLPAGILDGINIDKNVQKVDESLIKQAENLINHIEDNKTVFWDDERNLIMNYAYHIQNMDKVEKLANELKENAMNGHKDFFQIQERIGKEIEMQTEGKTGKREILYGVEVSVDHFLHSSGYKEITQEVFDEIMDQRAENLGKHNTEMEKLDFSNCWFQNVTFDRKETGLMKGFDFSHSHFSDCNFKNAEFENSNFQDSHIYGCKIGRSDFSHCNFSNSVIAQTRDRNSSFTWCDFSNASFRQGSFTQTTFGTPNFNNVVMDGTIFSDTIVSRPSMENITLTKGGCTAAEIGEYADRTKEALQRYEKSLKENDPFSVPNTKANTNNVSKPSRIPSAPSNSLVKKLDENKIKAAGINKQNQPHKTEKEPTIR